MNFPAINHPLRRAACPGLSAPMATGDGLLVRLTPIGTIPLAAFAKLCAAARHDGNGVIEITSRGTIQVRGLSAASAPRFADAVAALDIAVPDGVPVLNDALAGLDPEETLDAGALAAELRHALARTSFVAKLAPKVSVVIDGGGALDLEALRADVRLAAQATNGRVMLHVSVGGDGTSATALGMVAPADGVAAAVRLLEAIAQRGPDGRAKDIIAAEGAAPLRVAIANLLGTISGSHLRGNERKRAQPIGLHGLRDGSFACGTGLAFGHTDATSLERLVEHARSAGANGVRTAPDRALLAIGLAKDGATAFAAAAERLGFVVRADDPRRHVVACAGAPICISAHIAARAMAPRIAASAAPYLDAAHTIHVSGCAKGCAHPGPAALTIVGTPNGSALIAHGTARDAPRSVVPTGELADSVAELLQEMKRGGRRHV
jgi:precorrin-3B synthase